MKKLLLAFTLSFSAIVAFGQVVVSGVSPAAIQGNYDFAYQADPGWPGYTAGQTADENWNLALDFNTDGVNIQGELELIYDATPGINPQGIDSMYEGCGTLLNTDLTNKIAIVYRNTCDFATKAYSAQQLGAIGLIIINREDDVNFLMTASATGDGPNVTIPVVMLTQTDGTRLINEMQNGPVEMFIGNKTGAFSNDIGGDLDFLLISPYGTPNSMMDNGFDLGIQVYNYGSAIQSNASVTVTIDGPLGNVYSDVEVLPTMNPGDTIAIYNGFTHEFNDFVWNSSNPLGEYTLTYTIDLGVADDFPFDNVFTSTFNLTDDKLSYARTDVSGNPIATSFTALSTGPNELISCMFYENKQIDLGLSGVTIVPHADTSINDLEGTEIFVNVYEWNSGWTDLTDASYFGQAATNDPYSGIQILYSENHYPLSNDETDDPVTVPFTPFVLLNNQRYLICAQTYDPNVSFGIDNGLNYSGELNVRAAPFHVVYADRTNITNPPGTAQWYLSWDGQSAASISLDVFDASLLGLTEESVVNGKAFPNPTNDNVTISVDANGKGVLTVTDISGKTALYQSINLVNGQTKVDLSKLDDGVYIFNIELENGKTSQFNVVKN